MSSVEESVTRGIAEYVHATIHGRAIPWHYLGTNRVRELEEKLSHYTGMRYALLVPSATTGLILIGVAIGLRSGAHFITGPFTWGSALVWLHLGCSVSFADVDPITFTPDPERIPRLVRPNTRVLLSSEPDGAPADDEALRRVAENYGLLYVADCSRSLGARRGGRPAGSRAHALVLSFTRFKTLDLGEGGAVLTNDPDLYEKLLLYGQHPLRQKRELGLASGNEVALNARIHPVAALWGAIVFEDALAQLRTRQELYRRLAREMSVTELVTVPDYPAAGIEPTYYRLPFTWRGNPAPEELCGRLSQAGWSVRVEPDPCGPIYRNRQFVRMFSRRVKSCDCPVAEGEAARRWIIHLDGPGSRP